MINYPSAEEKRAENLNYDALIDKIFSAINNQKTQMYIYYYCYDKLPDYVIEFVKNKGYDFILEEDRSLTHYQYKVSW